MRCGVQCTSERHWGDWLLQSCNFLEFKVLSQLPSYDDGMRAMDWSLMALFRLFSHQSRMYIFDQSIFLWRRKTEDLSIAIRESEQNTEHPSSRRSWRSMTWTWKKGLGSAWKRLAIATTMFYKEIEWVFDQREFECPWTKWEMPYDCISFIP